MLLDGNYDILDAYIPRSIGVFDRPATYDALGQSAITNIFSNGPGIEVAIKTESETNEEKDSDITMDENNMEETYKPEYMGQEEWETCINSPAYSEEECREMDEYYAHGEGQNEPGHAYEYYTNDRFGFFVKYPDNFTADSMPDNNDGIAVHDDSATLTVSGTHGWSSENGDYVTISEIDSIETLYEQEIAELEHAGLEIGYKSVKDNWYVISYINGSDIIYQKSIMASDFLANLIIEYPEELQENMRHSRTCCRNIYD